VMVMAFLLMLVAFRSVTIAAVSVLLNLLSMAAAFGGSAGISSGLDKFKAFNARMDHHYKEKLENIAVMVSKDGTRAAAEFNVNGVYKATDSGLPEAKGQTYILPAGTFFAIRDGKIARVTTYYNLTDWIAQVTG